MARRSVPIEEKIESQKLPFEAILLPTRNDSTQK